MPSQLVLVGVEGCDATCHKHLLSGEIEEIIHVVLPAWSQDQAKPITAHRYTADWVIPGTCPLERRRAYFFAGSHELAEKGFCPRTETVEVPTEGVFVVRERFLVRSFERARPFTPRYLIDAPPGRVISFQAAEVQVRKGGKVEVVARARSYTAPGFLGLPPLIGCWGRPENIIWTLPVGDTGCGFWRLITGGGVREMRDVHWVFDAVFAKRDRPVTPPVISAQPPPTPAQALEILRNGPASSYLTNVKDALVAPENSNEALIEMVLGSDRRGELNGALIAWLAQTRRAVALAIPTRLPVPQAVLSDVGALISALEQDAPLRAAYTDFMFDALSASWRREAREIPRLLDLMQTDSPAWLCSRLDRVTREGGLLQRRDKIMSGGGAGLPDFLRPLLERALSDCGESGLALLRRVLAWPSGLRREAAAEFITGLAPDISAAMSDQALANLLDDHNGNDSLYRNRGRHQHYVVLQTRILLRAGFSCADVKRRMEVAVEARRRQGAAVSPQVSERLSMLGAQGDKQLVMCRLPPRQPSRSQ